MFGLAYTENALVVLFFIQQCLVGCANEDIRRVDLMFFGDEQGRIISRKYSVPESVILSICEIKLNKEDAGKAIAVLNGNIFKIKAYFLKDEEIIEGVDVMEYNIGVNNSYLCILKKVSKISSSLGSLLFEEKYAANKYFASKTGPGALLFDILESAENVFGHPGYLWSELVRSHLTSNMNCEKMLNFLKNATLLLKTQNAKSWHHLVLLHEIMRILGFSKFQGHPKDGILSYDVEAENDAEIKNFNCALETIGKNEDYFLRCSVMVGSEKTTTLLDAIRKKSNGESSDAQKAFEEGIVEVIIEVAENLPIFSLIFFRGVDEGDSIPSWASSSLPTVKSATENLSTFSSAGHLFGKQLAFLNLSICSDGEKTSNQHSQEKVRMHTLPLNESKDSAKQEKVNIRILEFNSKGMGEQEKEDFLSFCSSNDIPRITLRTSMTSQPSDETCMLIKELKESLLKVEREVKVLDEKGDGAEYVFTLVILPKEENQNDSDVSENPNCNNGSK